MGKTGTSFPLMVINAVLEMNTMCGNIVGQHLLQPGEDMEYLKVDTTLD